MINRELGDRGVKVGTAFLLASAVVVIALCLAYWFWYALSPQSPHPTLMSETLPVQLTQGIQSRHLFGQAEVAGVGVPALIGAAQMALIGIVSSADREQGLAIIVLDGKKPVTAKTGQEVAPDLVLSRVGPDYVELVKRGQKINLRLATKK